MRSQKTFFGSFGVILGHSGGKIPDIGVKNGHFEGQIRVFEVKNGHFFDFSTRKVVKYLFRGPWGFGSFLELKSWFFQVSERAILKVR